MRELLTSTETDQETHAMVKNLVPLGRFVLASDDSSYVAGVELFADAGFASL